MRLFFALPLEEEARARVQEIIERLAATGCDYKWVERENLHVTLAFLGEKPDSALGTLKEAGERAAASVASFDLSFDALGAFDSIAHPRVVWLGAGRGADALKALALNLGEGDSRPFQAHLTLGRRRGHRGLLALREELETARFPPIQTRAARFVLMRSRLSSKGPKYEELESFVLRLP